MLKKISAALLLVLFTSACAHQQAMFISEPAGAQVLINGKEIGTTPCAFDYKASAGETYEVCVKKDGYEMVEYAMVTDEVDKGARAKWIAAGLAIPMGSPLFLGALFTKKLKDSYEFVMKPEAPRFTAQGPKEDDRIF